MHLARARASAAETQAVLAAERAAAAEALQEGRAKLEAALASMTDAVFISDVQGRFIDFNDAFATFHKFRDKDECAKTFAEYPDILDVFMPDGTLAPLDMWAVPRALRGETVTNAEYTLRRKDTGETWVGSYSFGPIRDKDGAIVGSVVIGRDITELKRAEEELRRSRDELEMRVQERTAELEKANKTLRELSSRLLSVQEEERKRISGEIHDTFGSCLSGIKFKVEDVLEQVGKDSNAIEGSLRNVIPVIQEGIEECRRMQQDLRPAMLDDLGLLPTLSWFCRRYQTIYAGIKIDLEKTLEEGDIPNSLKIVIFRVTQEGLNNIAKHSKADLVHLSLRKMDGRIQLILEDNGQGFDLAKVLSLESTKRGLGLTSMRERVELSRGFFAIESAEGKGTTLRSSWPLGEDG